MTTELIDKSPRVSRRYSRTKQCSINRNLAPKLMGGCVKIKSASPIGYCFFTPMDEQLRETGNNIVL